MGASHFSKGPRPLWGNRRSGTKPTDILGMRARTRAHIDRRWPNLAESGPKFIDIGQAPVEVSAILTESRSNSS